MVNSKPHIFTRKSIRCGISMVYYIIRNRIKLLTAACTCMLFADNEGLSRTICLNLTGNVGA